MQTSRLKHDREVLQNNIFGSIEDKSFKIWNFTDFTLLFPAVSVVKYYDLASYKVVYACSEILWSLIQA